MIHESDLLMMLVMDGHKDVPGLLQSYCCCISNNNKSSMSHSQCVVRVNKQSTQKAAGQYNDTVKHCYTDTVINITRINASPTRICYTVLHMYNNVHTCIQPVSRQVSDLHKAAACSPALRW